jgi:thiol-disulfide isomerase/thioredoxin
MRARFGLLLLLSLPGLGCATAPRAALPLDLSALRGRVVVIDFWATWCAACPEVLEQAAALQRREPALTVLAVSVDEVGAALDGVPAPLRLARDPGGRLAASLGVVNLPAQVVLDAQGRVRYRGEGEPGAEMAAREARLLLER